MKFIVSPPAGADWDVQIIDVQACTSKEHDDGLGQRPAEVIAHLVQGPTPYCPDCAAGMRAIYKAMGTHLHLERIDLPIARRVDGSVRQYTLDD
jgi:hypothetical protein